MLRPSFITLLYLLVVCILPGQLQPVFNDNQCSRFGVFEVTDNEKVSLTVTGLKQHWAIYWSVSGPSTNGTEIRLADCEVCHPNCSSTNCTVFGDERFDISRPVSRASTLLFVGDVESIHGSTVKCAQFNNASIATCSIISVLTDYKLSPCDQDELEVTDSEPWTAITCHNLKDHHNIRWTITDPSNHSTEVATCQACTECNTACTTSTDDVTVSRTGSVSELRIVGKVMEKNNATLTCGREDGSLQASCRIRVTSVGHANSDKSSTTDVSGGVVAGVLCLLLVVVAVVVIVKRRNLRNIFTGIGLGKGKKQHSPQPRQHENTSVSSHNHAPTKPRKSASGISSGKEIVADDQGYSHLKEDRDARSERPTARDEQTTAQAKRVVTDTYAKVNKQAKGNNLKAERLKPDSGVQSTDITVAETGCGKTGPDGATYARVNKNKKTPNDQGNSAAEYTDCSSQLKDENPAAHAYINLSGVPEGDVPTGTFTTGTNLTVLFASDGQDVTKTAECDDDYNTLHQTTQETRNRSTYDRIVQPV